MKQVSFFLLSTACIWQINIQYIKYIVVLEFPVYQLKEFRKQYESYVPMEYKVYLKKMKRFANRSEFLIIFTIESDAQLFIYSYMDFSADLVNGGII